MAIHTSMHVHFSFFFIVTFSIPFSSIAPSKTHNFLPRGSFLSVEDNSDILTSPDNTFTCGFYGEGQNAYWFSIWFTNSKERTVVWMANRDKPVNGKGSRISFHRNGALVLTDVDGSTIWETNTISTDVIKAELLNTGNLVLINFDGKIIWQSFDFPINTLLPNQLLTKSTKLVSNLGRGRYGSRYFSLFFDNNNNVLTLLYDVSIFDSGRTSYNSSRIAVFEEMGNFLSSDRVQFSALDMGFGIKRRLTMDDGGNLRLYSLNNETGLWVISWKAILEQCKVHGICGRNGICTFAPEPKRSCPPFHEITEPGNWNKGCKPKYKQSCLESQQQVIFVEVPHIDFYGFDLNYTENVSRDACLKLCLDDCRCSAFNYRLTGQGVCYTKSELYNGHGTPNVKVNIFLKLPASLANSEPTVLNVTDPKCAPTVLELGSPSMYDTASGRVRWAYFYYFASAIGLIEILFAVSAWWFLFRRRGVKDPLKEGYRALTSQFISSS